MGALLDQFEKDELIIRQKMNEWVLIDKPEYHYNDLIGLEALLIGLERALWTRYKYQIVNVKQLIKLFLQTGYSEEVLDAVMKQFKEPLPKGDKNKIVKIRLEDDTAITTERSPTKTTRDNLENCIRTLIENKSFADLEVMDTTKEEVRAKQKYYAPFLSCIDILVAFSMLDARECPDDFLAQKRKNENLRIPKRDVEKPYKFSDAGYEIGKRKYLAWIERSKARNELYTFSLYHTDVFEVM